MVEVVFINAAARGMLCADGFSPVVCLDLGLSMGDIVEPLSDQRAIFLQSTVLISGPGFDKVGRDMVQAARDGMAQILSAVQRGEPIRAWYSQMLPDEYCGFCHLLDQLPGAAEIHAVELPSYVCGERHTTRYAGWGDVAPSEFAAFSQRSRCLSRTEIAYFAAKWREMRLENGPLRAIVNGQLQTVGVDFYDCFLLREMEAAPMEFQQAHIIGNVLGKYSLGISDSLLALRMEEMVAGGILFPLTEAPENAPIYRRFMRKEYL